MDLFFIFYIYLAVINIIAIILTVYDKHQAVRNGWRVKEFTLLSVSFLGGSFAMYITMQLIRHKTKKLKFMLGIPLIIVLQCIICAAVIYFVR